jgi:phosphoglycolate phosphatase
MLQELRNTPKKYILFDLDGTIIDSAESILSSFDKVFQKHKISPLKKIDKHIIGPPLIETFINLIEKPTDKLINSMVEDFKFFYDEEDYKLSRLFPGILECLKSLKNQKKTLIIITNKRKAPTKKIIELFNLDEFFKSSYSLDSFNPKMKSKSNVIKNVLTLECIDPKKAIYVGDRIEDGEASNKNNIEFIMVPWGYN